MNEEASTKTIRVLSLFEMLNNGEIIKKKEAADRFNVSEKTILRDLKEINIYYSNYKYNTLVNSVSYNRVEKGYFLKVRNT
ncbi:DeoR family transcriptional regulator [Cytobacillus firmus]|uniref:DeoR family transcriptional regulator n=1 Tax=Cytobacillus firmus TaxID=1399 RepID=UPI0024C1064B|nr:DeoR family transcriptional regulator [Cytobacillus firmus]WHY33840.1 DeoR family transcriptional regulator [Cytobacillus firmus]